MNTTVEVAQSNGYFIFPTRDVTGFRAYWTWCGTMKKPVIYAIPRDLIYHLEVSFQTAPGLRLSREGRFALYKVVQPYIIDGAWLTITPLYISCSVPKDMLTTIIEIVNDVIAAPLSTEQYEGGYDVGMSDKTCHIPICVYTAKEKPNFDSMMVV